MPEYVTPTGVKVSTSDAVASSVGYKPAEPPKSEPAKKAPAKKSASSKSEK